MGLGNERVIKPEWCLLCFSPVGPPSEDSCEKEMFANLLPNLGISPLNNQLKIIFVLKTCLELPEERLSYYVYKWGDPENWIGLCGQCSEIVKEATKISVEIGKLERKLRDLKGKMVEIVRGSGKREVLTVDCKEYRSRPKELRKAMEITNLTRTFVRKNEYKQNCNPFLEGDRRAKELALKLLRPDDVDKTTLNIPDDDKDDGEVEMMSFDDGDNYSSLEDSDDDDDDSSASSDSDSDLDEEVGKKLKEIMLKDSKVKKDDVIRCSVCNKEFGTTQLRDAHEKVHKMDEKSLRHKCPFCQQGFTRLDYYRIHLRSHKVQDKPEISKEDKLLAKAEVKERRLQEKMNKYPCTECSLGFPKLKELEKHLETEHSEDLVPVVCDLCGKAFARERSLKKHVKKVHETERLYSLHCAQCGMGMKSGGKLRQHLKDVHCVWEMNQYICEVEGCKKKYQFKVDLDVHMAKHNGKAPYQCEHCGKDFWQGQQMRRHVTVVHSGNRETKPFKCELCGKGFAIQHYVYTHKRKVHFKKDNKGSGNNKQQSYQYFGDVGGSGNQDNIMVPGHSQFGGSSGGEQSNYSMPMI